MIRISDELKQCPNCERLESACECTSRGPDYELAEFSYEEKNGGINVTGTVRKLRERVELRIDYGDNRPGAFWSYDPAGFWRVRRNVVTEELPLMLGANYRRGHSVHVADSLLAHLVREKAFIYPDKPDHRFVSVSSGLFDITTGEVVPHTQEVMSFYQLQVEPDFEAFTPEFDKFLADILHPDDIERVLDILAYLLVPGNLRQRAIMFTGSGRNGKGVLMDLVTAMLGDQNNAAIPLHKLSARFDAARLYGKPLNMAGEISAGRIDDTDTFKKMTGEDPVSMDVKHSKGFDAYVWAVPVFSANTIPSSSDSSYGYLRRWEVVEFPNEFDGSDTTLKARLRAELPGIAGKILRHAVANLAAVRLSEPESLALDIRVTDSGRRAHDVLARRSDPVREWLSETELQGHVLKTDAYQDYLSWLEDGNGKNPLSKRNFYERVQAVLGEPKPLHGYRGWRFGGGKNAPSEPENAPSEAETAPRLHPDSGPANAVTSTNDQGGAKGAVSDSFIYGLADSGPPSEARADPELSEGWDALAGHPNGVRAEVDPDPFEGDVVLVPPRRYPDPFE